MICNLFPEPTFLLFSSDIPPLLYYSHIPTTILALIVGLFILINNRKNLLNQLIFVICVAFSLWTFINVILWTNIHSDVLLFVWSFLRVLSSLISILSIYFIYVFLEKKDVSLTIKAIFITLLAPVIILAASDVNVSGLDITNCDAYLFEGIIYKWVHFTFGVIAIAWITTLLIKHYIKASAEFKKQILLMGLGIGSFLLLFFTIIPFSAYLTNLGIIPDSRLEMYGLFGMDIFMIFITILMVRFKAFNVGLVASQGLVVALVILVGSQFTFITSLTSKILVGITLILTAAAGILLNRSVKKEIALRVEIEQLAQDLARANTRLEQLDKQKSEFVSIASHQLRSPLTSIAGYASLLREGNYGVVPNKMLEPLDRIEQSARFMAESIEDYLNVSRIESGNMKYHLTDFNLRETTERICDDVRSEALRKGLVLLFRTNMTKTGIVHADQGKIQQILHNLINNALKYTPKGSINVVVRDEPRGKRIFVDIVDTGIGMDDRTLHSIFQKFERGEKANTVNVKGTGLGLYVALRMAEAMGGTITAHSDGDGKGSRFTLELPLVM
jgi:signal transduction histidine kinase